MTFFTAVNDFNSSQVIIEIRILVVQVDFYLPLNAFLSPGLYDALKLGHVCPTEVHLSDFNK